MNRCTSPNAAARFLACFLSLFLLAACSRYDRDPDLRLARDFIDAYYVMADQKAALALASDRAAETLRAEMALVEGLSGREEAYKTRDVVFDLKRAESGAAEANYFYELKIVQPGLGETLHRVRVVVDRKNAKIKDFRTIQ